jgi:FkbM family methyltransferase
MFLSSDERQYYELEFLVDTIREIGSLIIRNASDSGLPSLGALRILTVKPFFGAKSFAQYSEDLILMGALKSVEHGFYIDVGAMDPVKDSVTKLFYDKGWSGINIEPCRRSFDSLAAQRRRDINLCLAASSQPGSLLLHEIAETGLSTTIEKYSQNYIAQGLAHCAYSVPCRPLADICAEYALGEIHFLKIDVEGAEKSVLEGADFNRFRPWLLVIESTVPKSRSGKLPNLKNQL